MRLREQPAKPAAAFHAGTGPHCFAEPVSIHIGGRGSVDVPDSDASLAARRCFCFPPFPSGRAALPAELRLLDLIVSLPRP